MRTLVVPPAQTVRTLVRPAATTVRTLVKRTALPVDALRYAIDETETYLLLKNAAGTVVAKVPYVPP